MPPTLLSSASLLFFTASYLAIGRTARERVRRLLAGLQGEARVASALATAQVPERIDGLMVEAKPGQTAMIDHVVRGRRRLVVVETKNWSGTVSGGLHDQEWLQTRHSGEEVRHRNPVMQAKRQARILGRVTGVPIAWMVVMAGRCRPSEGGFPEGVVTVPQIPEVLPSLMDGPHVSGEASAERLMEAWLQLLAITEAPDAARAINRRSAEVEERSAQREWLGWIALAVASASVALQLMIEQGQV